MSVPADRVEGVVAELNENATPCAAVIGQITDGEPGTIEVTP